MPSIGDVRVNFLADTAAFTKNTQKGEATLLKFGATAAKAMAGATAAIAKSAGAVLNLRNVFIGAAAAFATSKLVGSMYQVAEEVDKVGKAARRLGMSVPQMSALRFAAGQAGVSFESLAAMSSKALINVSKFVAAGDTSLRLGKMTVALTDAAGRVRSITDLLPDIADGIKSAGSAGEQLRLSQTIFGKGGADQFITFLQESGDLLGGLRGKTAMAGRYGAIITEEDFRRLRDYGDAVKRLREAWFGVKVKFMAEIAPALEKMAEGLALRLADLPRQIRGTINAFKIAGGTGEDARKAGLVLAKAGEGLSDLLLTTAKESAAIFAVTATEGVRFIGANIAMDFVKAVREYLPGVSSLDPNVRSPEEVARLRTLRETVAQLERDRDALETLIANGVAGADRRFVEDQLRLTNSKLGNGRLKSADLDVRIAAAERELQLDAGAPAQVRAQMRAESAKAVAAQWEESTARMAKAHEKMVATFAEVGGYDTAAETPSVAGPTEGAKAIGEALTAWKRLTTSMAEGQARQGGTWGGFWDHLKGKVEEFTKAQANLEEQQDKLRASAQALAEEADPSLTLARRIAEMRELAAQFPEVLDPEKVSRLTQRWTADFQKMQDKARTFSQDMGDAIKGFAGSAGDAFARFALRAEGSMKDLLLSWTQTLVSMAATKLMFEPFLNAIGDAVGGAAKSAATKSTPRTGLGPPAEAKGGVWQSGQRFAFAAGGIVDGPTLFPYRRGVGLMGEAGPEAIMPLKRIGGYLGVRAATSGVTVNVIDQRSGGEQVQAREQRGPDGRRMVEIIVRDAVKGMASDGSLDKVLQGFGVKRRGTSR